MCIILFKATPFSYPPPLPPRAPLLACSEKKPALEELLTLYEDGVVDPEQQKTFVVAVRDCEEGDEAELEKLVGERLEAIWAAAVKPEVSTTL